MGEEVHTLKEKMDESSKDVSVRPMNRAEGGRSGCGIEKLD